MGIYNSPDKSMVRTCMDSILSQDFMDFEFIVCDDCSTDDTWDFLNHEYGADERVVLVRNKENGGLRVALNHCLEVARADYVVRQDSDDYSRGDRLGLLYRYAVSHPEVDVLGTAMVSFDENGPFGIVHPRCLNPKKKDFLPGTVVAHATTIMRKESVLGVGGYRVAWETTRCEDTDLYMRMYAAGCIIKNIDEPLYYVRQDKDCYARKKYIGRVKEAVVKFRGYRVLGMPPYAYVYVLRPLLIGLIPRQAQRKIKLMLSARKNTEPNREES